MVYYPQPQHIPNTLTTPPIEQTNQLAIKKYQKINEYNTYKKHCEGIKKEIKAIDHQQKWNLQPNQHGTHDIHTPRHS